MSVVTGATTTTEFATSDRTGFQIASTFSGVVFFFRFIFSHNPLESSLRVTLANKCLRSPTAV
jgi:hypothetical protein